MRFPRTLTTVLGVTAAVALLISGCATNAPKTQTPSASTTAQIVKNDAAAALVPLGLESHDLAPVPEPDAQADYTSDDDNRNHDDQGDHDNGTAYIHGRPPQGH